MKHSIISNGNIKHSLNQCNKWNDISLHILHLINEIDVDPGKLHQSNVEQNVIYILDMPAY